jgi:hypothetical protein
MDILFEQISHDFNIKAQKLFTITYEKFLSSTRNLNRVKDENVFQQQLGKYLNTLKLQLESMARELLDRNKSLQNITNCNKILADNIQMYLNEFRKKSGSV